MLTRIVQPEEHLSLIANSNFYRLNIKRWLLAQHLVPLKLQMYQNKFDAKKTEG